MRRTLLLCFLFGRQKPAIVPGTSTLLPMSRELRIRVLNLTPTGHVAPKSPCHVIVLPSTEFSLAGFMRISCGLCWSKARGGELSEAGVSLENLAAIAERTAGDGEYGSLRFAAQRRTKRSDGVADRQGSIEFPGSIAGGGLKHRISLSGELYCGHRRLSYRTEFQTAVQSSIFSSCSYLVCRGLFRFDRACLSEAKP